VAGFRLDIASSFPLSRLATDQISPNGGLHMCDPYEGNLEADRDVTGSLIGHFLLLVAHSLKLEWPPKWSS